MERRAARQRSYTYLISDERLGLAPLLTDVLLPLAALALGAALWYRTAMIYACLRFIEEWWHPLTLVNFVLLGLSSGLLLALCASAGADAFAAITGPTALLITALAWATRVLALRRNASIRHCSTLQSATRIVSPKLAQISMGMSAARSTRVSSSTARRSPRSAASGSR